MVICLSSVVFLAACAAKPQWSREFPITLPDGQSLAMYEGMTPEEVERMAQQPVINAYMMSSGTGMVFVPMNSDYAIDLKFDRDISETDRRVYRLIEWKARKLSQE